VSQRRRHTAWTLTLGFAALSCGAEAVEPARDAHAEIRSGADENTAPVVRSVRIEPQGEIAAGSEIALHPEAHDRDGDPISYRYLWWVNDATVPNEGPVLSTEGLRRGDRIRARVVATDGTELSEPFEAGEVTLTNAVPVIVSEPPTFGLDGHFHYEVRAEDPDGDRPLHYRLALAPEGMRLIDRDASIEWRPDAKQAGRHVVEVVVEDTKGGSARQRFELFVGWPGSIPAAPAL
jgi:hypothetical protein